MCFLIELQVYVYKMGKQMRLSMRCFFEMASKNSGENAKGREAT